MMFSITGTVRAPNERSNELLKPRAGQKERETEARKTLREIETPLINRSGCYLKLEV